MNIEISRTNREEPELHTPAYSMNGGPMQGKDIMTLNQTGVLPRRLRRKLHASWKRKRSARNSITCTHLSLYLVTCTLRDQPARRNNVAASLLNSAKGRDHVPDENDINVRCCSIYGAVRKRLRAGWKPKRTTGYQGVCASQSAPGAGNESGAEERTAALPGKSNGLRQGGSRDLRSD